MTTMKNIPIGSAYTAMDHPNGNTYILHAHEGLCFFDSMEHSLLPPAQLWDNHLQCDIRPKHCTNGESIFGCRDPQTDIHLPFSLYGCISYLPIRYPSEHELSTCLHITLTNDAPWHPYASTFHKREQPFTPNFAPEYLGETHDFTQHRTVSATSSHTHRSAVTPMDLARRWGTSIPIATNTLKMTTQRGIRLVADQLTRRFRTREAQLQYRYQRGPVYSDTLFHEENSLRGYNSGQVMVAANFHTKFYPMKSKADAFVSLNSYCTKYGIPNPIITDNAGEELGSDWVRVLKKFLMDQRTTKPHSPWQNKAEAAIRELKKHFRRIMNRTRAPEVLWCYAMEYVAEIREVMAGATSDLRPPVESVLGNVQDISEYIEFDFHGFIKFYDPHKGEQLGQWLGVCKNIGTGMVYYILQQNGYVISRSTICNLSKEEWLDENERKQRDEFEEEEYKVLGNLDESLVHLAANDEMEEPLASSVPAADVNPGNDEAYGPDELTGMEVYLSHGDRTEIAKVLGRKRNTEGNFVGRKHSNPILDSRVFTVEFPDGEQKDIGYNILAEHLHSQMDDEGNVYKLFRGIIGHRKKAGAVDKADQYRQVGNKQVKKKTLAGWDIEVEWVDGSSSWFPLKEVKNSNSVELAEYAMHNRLNLEPAFDWWVRDTLKRKKRLIKLSQRRHKKSGYKFGIPIPHDVTEALALDKQNNNTLWYDAIQKEMRNVTVAFEILEKGQPPPPGHQFVTLRMIFDLKMDFTRKARLVAGGHLTQTPASLTYASVPSRESIRLMFLVAALNDLNIVMTDIGNAYLNAKVREKIWSTAGPEFGEHTGAVVLIVRALYGLKSSGATWRAHFAQSLRDLGYESCVGGDPDVWRKPAVKPDGEKYYEYIVVYIDDLLVIGQNPTNITDALQADPFNYTLKDVDEPKSYLGAVISKYNLEGSVTWAISADDYLRKALANVEEQFGKLSTMFSKSQLSNPAAPDYHPEIDTSKLLEGDDVTLYQSYIGILRWAVELQRIDIAHATATMAKFMSAPRQGHMVGVLRILAYLHHHIRSKIVADPLYRDWSHKSWTQAEWQDFYPDAVEPIPDNAPEARGKPVQINLFCDAAHATCLITRRSTTGIIIFLNGMPILWYSKRQNTLESSTFGSEFVALRIAVEMNDALRIKLRMLGIPLEGPTNGFCDNESVVKNATIPESRLSKKHNAIAYHEVRESCACNSIRICHEPGKKNLSDVLTKFLPGTAHKQCITRILY